jgi:hypothetical protein
MKIIIVFLVILLFLLVGCGEKTTEIIVEDLNQDSVYRIGSESGLLGNVDMHMIPWTIQGSAIVLINGPGSHIGYDIRKKDDYAYIYFADSYVSAGGHSLQSGTQLSLDEWLRVRLVIYESGLAGWIVSLLQSLGLDFFESLEDYMIEQVYEADVYLSSEPSKGIKISEWQKATQKYKNNF